jgi:hypothetical protein
MALWDHVQNNSADSGSGTSANLAFGSNITAGGIICVSARLAEVAQNPGCTDSLGNTWAASFAGRYCRHVRHVHRLNVVGGACRSR